MSLDFSICRGLANELICPCCVAENMCKEYAAVKNLIMDTVINDAKENERIEEIKIISLRRLIDGGAAILAPVNKNHHRVIMGLIHINPLVKKILRVLVIS